MVRNKTKAQIARQKYQCTLSELSGGEKAAVTRAFNAQSGSSATPRVRATGGDILSVKFGRPGVNGTKECLVKTGTTVEDALKQSGLKINTSKEGVLDKVSGDVVMFNHPVVDGKTYAIVPGVDSSF